MINIIERLTTMVFFVVGGCLALLIFLGLLIASNALGGFVLTAFNVGG